MEIKNTTSLRPTSSNGSTKSSSKNTRKKKDNCDFCGTHSQSAPHGLICNNVDKKSIEVVTEDIKGIIYYVDNMQNVYRDVDIIDGKENPKIIAKYEKNDGVASILEFYS